jgi:CBS domain-containing protein
MHNFKELKVWQQARVMVKEVYVITADFPVEEKFGLVSQIRRSAVPVPSNIAEGAGRNGNKEFAQFFGSGNKESEQPIKYTTKNVVWPASENQRTTIAEMKGRYIISHQQNPASHI